jgi:hypothetical protein
MEEHKNTPHISYWSEVLVTWYILILKKFNY